MKLVYVAGPFRSMNTDGSTNCWGIQKNVMRAMDVALEVWKGGHVAICPHSNTMFFQNADGVPDGAWLKGDLIILEKCHAMVLVEGWHRSSGTREEIKFANQNKIPVYESVANFLAAERTGNIWGYAMENLG